jgi:hypothetical protein
MSSLLRQASAWNAAKLCALALLSACGGGGNDPSVPANITLNPSSISFAALGQTQQLSPTVTDQQGNVLTESTVTWTSSDAGVVTVSSTGLVTAQSSGSAQVTATAGAATAVVEVVVAQTPTQMQKISGDGETAVAGQAVPNPPAVQVQDANNNPVSGVAVTFALVSGRGAITESSAITDNNGIARLGSWRLGSKGANVLQATAQGTGISGSPAVFTAVGTSLFNITLRFLGSSTPSQQQAFANAQARWESLVIGDLSNVQLEAAAGECGSNSPAMNEAVDDLVILVTLEPIDGPGDVLGSAGPCFVRTSGDLSVLGAMIFDSEDLEDIEAEGLLQDLILHEMGHVLGFGSLWDLQGLLADPSLPPTNGIDPHFTGPQAIGVFNSLGGSTYTGNKVPVENIGGEGTADGHWRESVFANELMTGFVDAGQNPLSNVTVASLADQGYAVNMVGADPYSLALSLRALSASPRLKLTNDVLRVPIRRIDSNGRVVSLFDH